MFGQSPPLDVMKERSSRQGLVDLTGQMATKLESERHPRSMLSFKAVEVST